MWGCDAGCALRSGAAGAGQDLLHGSPTVSNTHTSCVMSDDSTLSDFVTLCAVSTELRSRN